MNKIRSAFLGLPVAVLAIAGMSFSIQGPEAQDPDLSEVIGVVNALQVRTAYAKAIAGSESLRRLNESYLQGVRQREDLIKQMEMEVDSLDPSAQVQRARMSLQIELARRELQGNELIHRDRLLMQGATLQVAIYEDIWEAAAKVAQAKGLKLVLRVRELPAGAPLDVRQAFHDRRNVLYHVGELDLTQDVINMLKL